MALHRGHHHLLGVPADLQPQAEEGHEGQDRQGQEVNWLTGPFMDWLGSSYGNSWAVLGFLVFVIVLPVLFAVLREPKPKLKKKRP